MAEQLAKATKLRSTRGAELVAEGLDIGMTSQLLGHEGPENTIKSYSRFQQSELQRRHKEFKSLDAGE